MKITHEKGSSKVAFDSLLIGEVVRVERDIYGMVIRHGHTGISGLLWLSSGDVVFGVDGDTLFEVVDAELIIRGDGGVHDS